VIWAALGIALALAHERFRVDGVLVDFEVLVPGNAIISQGCRPTPGAKLTCQAAGAIRSVSPAHRRGIARDGQTDEGAEICTRLGGRTAAGTDRQGNENLFCRFEDGSLTDASTILFYLQKPEKKPR
jgi:putative hemolysin